MVSISVDGNISSGKSTLVSRLVEEFPSMTSRPLDVEVCCEHFYFPSGKQTVYIQEEQKSFMILCDFFVTMLKISFAGHT